MLLSRLPLPLRGARLACVRPAASVRSEPGSNSQVVERRSLASHCVHVIDGGSSNPLLNGRPQNARLAKSSEQKPELLFPQGPRRLRFSFFRFTCQRAPPCGGVRLHRQCASLAENRPLDQSPVQRNKSRRAEEVQPRNAAVDEAYIEAGGFESQHTF